MKKFCSKAGYSGRRVPANRLATGRPPFIALPQGRIPQSSLPITGLQPGSQNTAATQASVAAIRALGGVFARAESDGILAAVLPREGRYYLLMISKNVMRSENEPILDRDLVKMKQYFAEPEALIGAKQVRLATCRNARRGSDRPNTISDWMGCRSSSRSIPTRSVREESSKDTFTPELPLAFKTDGARTSLGSSKYDPGWSVD